MIQKTNILQNWIKRDELVNDFEFGCELHEIIQDDQFESLLIKKELFTDDEF